MLNNQKPQWDDLQTITKDQMLEHIYKTIAYKQLSLWCVLRFKEKEMDDKYWDIVLFKYVRQWSSSSEWYDWYKTQRGDLVCANMREWEFRFISKRYRSPMYRKPDEEWERICDDLVDKYFTIIWHDVMIWDTFERFRQEEVRDKLVKQFDDIYNLYIGVMKMRKDKRKPINKQSEDCIRLIYSFC